MSNKKTIKYTLWTEDLGSWMSIEYGPVVGGPVLFDTREEAEEHLEKYCKKQNIERGIDDLLAFVEEVET
jgi:hypothetical protein